MSNFQCGRVRPERKRFSDSDGNMARLVTRTSHKFGLPEMSTSTRIKMQYKHRDARLHITSAWRLNRNPQVYPCHSLSVEDKERESVCPTLYRAA